MAEQFDTNQQAPKRERSVYDRLRRRARPFVGNMAAAGALLAANAQATTPTDYPQLRDKTFGEHVRGWNVVGRGKYNLISTNGGTYALEATVGQTVKPNVGGVEVAYSWHNSNYTEHGDGQTTMNVKENETGRYYYQFTAPPDHRWISGDGITMTFSAVWKSNTEAEKQYFIAYQPPAN